VKDFHRQIRLRIQLPLHPSVAIVSKRLGTRLAVLLIFAALPIPHGIGFAKMFVMLTGINVITSTAMALLRRERPDTRAMTHWDEAIVMTALFTIARLLT
jgi:hypothetical protein